MAISPTTHRSVSLVDFPDDILLDALGSFLSPKDSAHLGLTCQKMQMAKNSIERKRLEVWKQDVQKPDLRVQSLARQQLASYYLILHRPCQAIREISKIPDVEMWKEFIIKATDQFTSLGYEVKISRNSEVVLFQGSERLFGKYPQLAWGKSLENYRESFQ